MGQNDDLEKRFSQGDQSAFEVLFRARQQDVYRWILQIVRDPSAAEDLTVETFWRAYKAARRFNPERQLGPWLRTIAVNVARKHVSRKRPEVLIEDLARYGPSDSTSSEDLEDRRRAVVEAFKQLPESLRTVALLALVERVPYIEIAESMQLTVNAVKARVFRAVRRLRVELIKRGVVR